MSPHELVKLLNGVGIWARSNVKHESKLWLHILANGLEEPLVRVDLTIVAMLDAKHEVDAAALEHIRINIKVPRSRLETVKQVGWVLIDGHFRIHHVTHVLHLELVVSIDLHEVLLEEQLLIEELLLTG